MRRMWDLATWMGLGVLLAAGCAETPPDEQTVDDWTGNEGYAATADLAAVALSGSYADLTGTPNLGEFARSASLAAVAASGAYADLSGAPDLSDLAATADLAAVATSGSYADLTDAPTLAGVALTGSYHDLDGAPALAAVATSGSFADLTGAPALAAVATSGSFADLSNAPALAPVATSGLYLDLIGAPALGAVATTGAYSDLTGAPSLAPVATTGAYGDLTGAPALADVATSGSYDDLSGAPDLATVATTGDYQDLSGAPDLATVATTGSYGDLTDTPPLATVATTGDYQDLSGAPDLATVATTGSYADLTGAPALATVATSGSYEDLTDTPPLATVAMSGSYEDLAGTPPLSAIATSGSYFDLQDTPQLAAVAISGLYDDLVGRPWQTADNQGEMTTWTDLSVRIGSALAVGGLRVFGAADTAILGVLEEGTLDQQSLEAPYLGGNFGPWQTFTAGQTGYLTRLDVISAGEQAVTVTVFAGEGLGGPVLYSGAHTLVDGWGTPTPFTMVTLSPPPAVTAGATYTWLVSDNVNNLGIALSDTYPGGYFGKSAGWDLAFRTVVSAPATPPLTMTPAGVGIGVTDPQYALHVAGTIAGSGPYQELSDGRLKQDVEPLSGALAQVEALRPVTYRWTPEAHEALHTADGEHLGFIAQEVESLLPQVVSQDASGRRTMAYGALVPVLTRAIQEQQAIIQTQDAALAELQGRLERLEAAVGNGTSSR